MASAQTDDRVGVAMSCFDNTGGPSQCATVMGWCDWTHGAERRQACQQALYQGWDAVLNRIWSDLRVSVEALRPATGPNNSTDVWSLILAEQRAWLAFRDSRCSWSFGPREYDVASPAEEKSICLQEMTLARADELYFMLMDLEARGYSE